MRRRGFGYPWKSDPSPDVIRQMVQALLTDRFKVVIERETRDGPAYVLARNGLCRCKRARVDASSVVGALQTMDCSGATATTWPLGIGLTCLRLDTVRVASKCEAEVKAGFRLRQALPRVEFQGACS